MPVTPIRTDPRTVSVERALGQLRARVHSPVERPSPAGDGDVPGGAATRVASPHERARQQGSTWTRNRTDHTSDAAAAGTQVPEVRPEPSRSCNARLRPR